MSIRSSVPALRSAGLACRSVAVCLLSGWLTGRSFDEVEARIAGCSTRDQAVLVGAVLTALFLAALLSAQAGVVGLAIFGAAVVLVAR